jgi:hypothetical protein
VGFSSIEKMLGSMRLGRWGFFGKLQDIQMPEPQIKALQLSLSNLRINPSRSATGSSSSKLSADRAER